MDVVKTRDREEVLVEADEAKWLAPDQEPGQVGIASAPVVEKKSSIKQEFPVIP